MERTRRQHHLDRSQRRPPAAPTARRPYRRHAIRAAKEASGTARGPGPAAATVGLKEARADRDAQRDQPGFAALTGRERVWIRDPYEDEVHLEELGPDGRRLRQVTVEADGTTVRTGPDDWPFNPPRDLYDPKLLRYEISADDFEQAWNATRLVGGCRYGVRHGELPATGVVDPRR
jgi:hypothetical protein